MNITEQERERVTQLVGVLDTIKNESSRLKHEDILVENSELPYFKEVLHFVYNTLIKTGISKSKINKFNSKGNQDSGEGFNTLLELLEYVKENNTGRDTDLLKINHYISRYSGIELEYLKGIVTKDLALGISSNTVNKVYKNLIPKFGIMSAYAFTKYQDKLVDKSDETHNTLKEEYAITLKLDGNRCVAVLDTDVKILSRSGKDVTGLKEIEEELSLLSLDKKVLDGEAIHESYFREDSKEKAYAETSKVMRTKGIKEGMVYVIFDMLPLDEFTQGESSQTYEERRKELKKLEEEAVEKGLKRIKVVPIIRTTNRVDIVQSELSKALANNEEGIMLNALKGKYKTKRVKDILKLKNFYTLDLKCIGIEEEIRGNSLGALVVEYKGNEVRVGSGLTLEQRKLFWENPELVINKIIEVQGSEESTNKDGKYSLRFPSFIQVREDKDTVSYD